MVARTPIALGTNNCQGAVSFRGSSDARHQDGLGVKCGRPARAPAPPKSRRRADSLRSNSALHTCGRGSGSRERPMCAHEGRRSGREKGGEREKQGGRQPLTRHLYGAVATAEAVRAWVGGGGGPLLKGCPSTRQMGSTRVSQAELIRHVATRVAGTLRAACDSGHHAGNH